MKILGFNFTKILAEKKVPFRNSKITTNIKFSNIEKDTAEMLKESEIIKIFFEHDLSYKSEKEDFGKIAFEGVILLSVTEEQSKNYLKSWKKKTFPEELRFPLSNLILRKCTSKVIQLQDELNLPTHIPIPVLDKKN